MLQRIFSYYNNTVHWWDYLKTPLFFQKNLFNIKDKRKKLKIGFCAVFPPFQNGAAAATYYIVKELAKHPEIDLYLIPIKNKIDKKLFSFMPLSFAKLHDPNLDLIIFFSLGHECETYARKTSCKTIAWQTMHEDPEHKESEQRTFASVNTTDFILAISKWAYTCYSKQTKQVAYLPHGVDTTLFRPAEKKTKVFTCLFVSRIHYYKGIMPFLDSIPLVLEKDSSICFRVVAPIDKNSAYLEEVENKIAWLCNTYPTNIVIDTRWLPYDQIPRQYTDSDLLIFPSNNEGFGIPLIEAMSAEIPCIVLDKKPMNEIVIDGKTGYCLKPDTNKERYHGFTFPAPEAIAEKILFLKNNPSIKNKMSKAAREHVLAHYTLSSIIDALLSFCYTVTRGQKK